MSTLITVIHIVICVLLVILVLIQSGRGGDMGALSGGGSSQTIFGSSGGANFFTRLTTFFAFGFMVTSIVLTLIGSRSRSSVFDGVEAASTSVNTGTEPSQEKTAKTPPPATETKPSETKPKSQ